MDIIELIFRNESVFMVKNDITGIIDRDWFLTVILNWNDESKKIYINDDKNTAMSIIETLRFNKLIVYPNVSLDYMHALADKWCLPENIIKVINDRIVKTNHQTKIEFDIIDNMVFKCLNCETGFKMSENFSDSCICHPCRFDVNRIQSTFRCCGGDKNSKPCTKGYHVLCNSDRVTYLELKKKESK
jgi:hypothetical protein